MSFLGKSILPLILILGSIYLVLLEILLYPRLKRYGHPEKSLNVRMGRRVTGAFLVVIVAVMMFWGLNFMPKPEPGVFQKQAAHWAAVVALVFVIVLLAIWDAADGLKYLEKLADQITRENLSAIDERVGPEQTQAQGEKKTQ